MLRLEIIKRTDPRQLSAMKIHYSQPKGFVRRNICYGIFYNDIYYGSIVGGSSTLHLPGRNEFFNFENTNNKSEKTKFLNSIVNNIFYHIEKVNGEYPCRNFTTKVIKEWRRLIKEEWERKYNDKVIGFETLVELPRNGECYKREGWNLVGQTKGFTCKRVAGKGSDGWSGNRVWNKDEENLRPKLVFCKFAD